MKFNAYQPTKLKGIVDLIWEQEISHRGDFTILPSGKVEFIFPIHPIATLEAINISAQENPVNNHSCFLSGIHTKPLKMTFNKFHAIGIQLKPVGVKALFGMPLCEIRNYYVEGEVVFKTIHIIEEQLKSKISFKEKAQWIENFILRKINETADLHMAINLDVAIKKYIIQKQGGSSKSITDILGYSRTQTFRLFNEWFGNSAHTHFKLLQFIGTTETLHNRSLKLLDAGLIHGFYDQSHFIRTFQAFADMTPSEYRKRMSDVPGQIYT